MQALARLSHPAQVVAVCGRNEALKAELTERIKDLPKPSAVSFTLLGFTTEMDELMTAADLFVGKPGGLTTSEVLAKGLPMVVINPIPGQEERNSDHLLEAGSRNPLQQSSRAGLQDRHADRHAGEAGPDERKRARNGKAGRGLYSGRPARHSLSSADPAACWNRAVCNGSKTINERAIKPLDPGSDTSAR